MTNLSNRPSSTPQTKEQCQQWAMKNWKGRDLIEHDIAIVDERTARDGTLLMSVWKQNNIDFADWGPLPPKAEAWYDFRIHHNSVFTFFSQVHFGPPEVILRIYYQQPEKYTEAGVFDPLKVDRAMMIGEYEDENFL